MRKLILIFALVFVSFALSQVETSQPRAYSLPQFYFDVLNSSSDDSTMGRIEIYTQIPYEFLQFIKSDDRYTAKYEITVSISTLKGKLITERVWTQEVSTVDFDQTVSRAFWDISHRDFKLPFGDYKISVQVVDLDTRNGIKKEGTISVRNLRLSPLNLTDIMLVSSLKIEDQTKVIVPNVSNTVTSSTKNFYAFFEVNNLIGVEDTAMVTYKVQSVKKKRKAQEVSFTGSSVYPVKPGWNSIILPIENVSLPFGDYVLYIEARMKSKPEVYSIAQKFFYVRWHEIPELITDLDKAVEQLVYIAKPEEMKYIKSAPDDIEKEKRFLEFWRKKDPTPGTLKNELMEEYYGRVKYANEHFSHYIEGWKTDMGMVYIIFGPPSSVDRHPFDINAKPYEIWYYYEINRRFIFLDETGFGDYRLITPLWDEWTRNRWR